MRCFVYSKPLNLAQTLRMFINHVAESVEHQTIGAVDAGEINGMPYITVHTSYVPRPTGSDGKQPTGQLKYFAARAESNATVCMHDEAGYNQTFERVVKRFAATQKFTEGHGDPAAKLMVWRDVSVARVGGAPVGVVEHRLYEGEAGYAYASSTSVVLPAADGKVLASDEVDNQFSDPQGGIVESHLRQNLERFGGLQQRDCTTKKAPGTISMACTQARPSIYGWRLPAHCPILPAKPPLCAICLPMPKPTRACTGWVFRQKTRTSSWKWTSPKRSMTRPISAAC